jgi:hypothetical protein
VIDYWLGSDAPGPVVLEILDGKGALVRRYSSEDRPESLRTNRYFAEAWLKPAVALSRQAGHHRFVWDLRYPRPRVEEYEYTIAAIWGKDTPAQPDGALAAPGKYTIRLTAGGRTETQTLVLEMDPRISVPREAMARQLDVALDAAEQMGRSFAAAEEVGAYRKRLPPSGPSPEKGAADRLAPFEGAGGFARLNRRFAAVFEAVESADNAPTAQALADLQSAKSEFETLLAKWKEIPK